MEGAYDGEIAATDAQVGRLLDFLAASGRLDNTVVVVVGDHGESLGEHGEQQHGFFVYDAAVRIPLIVAGPGVPVRAVPDQVRIVDVMPTILELAGVEAPPAVQGVSLMPLGRGERLDLLALQRDLVSALSLRLERADRGSRRPLQVHRARRAASSTTPRPIPASCTTSSASNPRVADALERALARHDREDWRSRRRRNSRDRSNPRWRNGCGRSATWRHGQPRDAGGPASRRPEGQDRPLQPAQARRAGLRRRPARRRDRESPGGARGRPRGDRGATRCSATCTSRPAGCPTRLPRTRRALAIDPEHEGAAWSLALAYQDAGKLDEARAGFERVRQLNPRGARAAVSARRPVDAAAATLRGAAALARERPDARRRSRRRFSSSWARRGIELKQLDAAQTALLEAMQAQAATSRWRITISAWSTRRAANAEPRWPPTKPRSRLSPKLYQPHFNLAKLLSRDGRAAEALAALSRGRGEESGVRHRLPVSGQGPARRRRSDGRRAGRRQGPGLRSQTPRWCRSATTCWRMSTRGWGARPKRRARSRQAARRTAAGGRAAVTLAALAGV